MSPFVSGLKNIATTQIQNANHFYETHLARRVQWVINGRTRLVSFISSKCSESEIYNAGKSFFKTLRNTGKVAGPVFFCGLVGLIISTFPSYIFVGVGSAIAIQFCKTDIKKADRLTQVALTVFTIAGFCLLPQATICSLSIAFLSDGFSQGEPHEEVEALLT